MPPVVYPKTAMRDAFFNFHFMDKKPAMHNQQNRKNACKNNIIDRGSIIFDTYFPCKSGKASNI